MSTSERTLEELIEEARVSGSGGAAAVEARVLHLLSEAGGSLAVEELVRRGAPRTVLAKLLHEHPDDKRRRPKVRLGMVGETPCCWLTSQGWNAAGRPSGREVVPTSDSIDHALMPTKIANWLGQRSDAQETIGAEILLAGRSTCKGLSDEIVARAWAHIQRRVGDSGGAVGSLVGGQLADGVLIERWTGERAAANFAQAWGVSESEVTPEDLAETLTVVEIELSRKGVEPLRSKVDRWGAVVEQLGAVRAVVWVVDKRAIADRLLDLGVGDQRRRPGQFLVSSALMGLGGEDLGPLGATWWPLYLHQAQ
jgi:hypothetical protein